MRIQLASDLHLEHLERSFAGERLVQHADGVDLLVLAGDVSGGTRGIELFADWPVPVVYVAGNHEGYGRDWAELVEQCRQAARGTAVRFLHDDMLTLHGVRILGCTLWTDYRLQTTQSDREQMMAEAEARLNDHRLIRAQGGSFSTHSALAEHERSRAWLEQCLAQPHNGKTLVVTHHGPSRHSVHPRYGTDPLNAAFVSDLDELVAHADLWVHGHVHDSFDYRVGGCRVVANPRGYALNRQVAENVSGLRFENPGFVSACVLEL